MPDGVSAIPGAGYLDTNCIWYVALILLLLYLLLLTLLQPTCQIIKIYPGLTSSSSSSSSFTLSSETIKKIHFMVANAGYDDQSLYDLSMSMGFELVCPVHRYKNTPEERLKLVDFYESPLGKVMYSKRGISIESLIEHMKPYSG